MRPDPYKRALSRRYQAKHGMISTNKATSRNDNEGLPTNISQEQLDFLNNEEEDEVYFDNEGTGEKGDSLLIYLLVMEAAETFTIQANHTNTNIYSCPRLAVDFLMESKQTEIKSDKDLEAALLAEYPAELLEYISDDPIIAIKPRTDKPLKAETSSVELSLQQSGPKTSPTSKTTQERKDKLALEDWLDEVL